MNVIKTGLDGLLLLEPKVFGDARGYFFESYNEQEFRKIGITEHFVQDNQSFSQQGVLRGLHLQLPPHMQGKLVRVIAGAVLDVALDVRKSSPTYGKHYRAELSASNKRMMYIPPGFAHGFLTLEPNTIFLYKCSRFYHKESEASILWNDPEIGIEWGIESPVLSEKDKEGKKLKEFGSIG